MAEGASVGPAQGGDIVGVDCSIVSPSAFEYDDFGRQTLHISFEGVVTETVYDDSLGAGGRKSETRFFDNLTQYNNGNATTSKVG